MIEPPPRRLGLGTSNHPEHRGKLFAAEVLGQIANDACAVASGEEPFAVVEALRFSPKLTVKWVARTNPLPVVLEGLRKAGLPEE